MCYTRFALNTSVVLCGPSGAVADLRLPPPVSSVSLTRNLKQGWQSKPPVRPRTRVRTATASASKKAILNVECVRSEGRALFGASGGTRLSALFRNADLSLCEGAIGCGEVYYADAGSGCGHPASTGRQRRAGNGADGNRQDAGVPDSRDRKTTQGQNAGNRRAGAGANARAGHASGGAIQRVARQATPACGARRRRLVRRGTAPGHSQGSATRRCNSRAARRLPRPPALPL